MRILFFAGGRSFGEQFERVRRGAGLPKMRPTYRVEREYLWQVLDDEHAVDPTDRLVHGNGTGADDHAEQWANNRGVQAVGYPACWGHYDKPAGPKRTYNFFSDWAGRHEARCKLVAMPGGPGTACAVERARWYHAERLRRGYDHGVDIRDERGWRPGQ